MTYTLDDRVSGNRGDYLSKRLPHENYAQDDFERDVRALVHCTIDECDTCPRIDECRMTIDGDIPALGDRIITAYRDLLAHQCVHASADGCTAYSREAAYRDLVAERDSASAAACHYMGEMCDEHNGYEKALRELEAENERLTALIDTLAGKHPDAAEMLFRERKLNETLLDLKDENEDLRNELNYCQAGDECVSLRECRAENEAALLNIDNLITERDELRDENERLTDALRTIADNGGMFDGYNAMNLRAIRAEARAEAAEKVCKAMVEYYEYDIENHNWKQVMEALAAWEATMPRMSDYGCSTPTRCVERDKAECEWCMTPQPASDDSSAACEEGAE